METILATKSTSISEFKANPAAAVKKAGREPFAVLTNNKPSFYVIEPELFEALSELYFEMQATPLIKKRLARLNKAVSVDIDDLQKLADLYKLKFDPDARKEWNALDGSIKAELKKVLAKRLIEPVIESARLHGELSHCFKIKSKSSGYRLIYTVNKNEVTVIVLSVGKRDKIAAYKRAGNRKNRK